MKNKIDQILNTIKQVTDQTNRNTFVIGISGGIDSCLTLKILSEYFSNFKIRAYYLPIENDEHNQYIKTIEKFCNIKIDIVNLTEVWKKTINDFGINDMNNANNIKSKIRSMFLFAKAFENNGLVISNLNYDEYYLGYFTKFGDSNGDIYPLINCLKKDIFEIAKYLKIPEEIINQAPSANLYPNQSDENEFGFSYANLDAYLSFESIDSKIENLISKRYKVNNHKKTLNHLINNNYRKD